MNSMRGGLSLYYTLLHSQMLKESQVHVWCFLNIYWVSEWMNDYCAMRLTKCQRWRNKQYKHGPYQDRTYILLKIQISGQLQEPIPQVLWEGRTKKAQIPTLKREEVFLKSKLRPKRYLEINQVFERWAQKREYYLRCGNCLCDDPEMRERMAIKKFCTILL